MPDEKKPQYKPFTMQMPLELYELIRKIAYERNISMAAVVKTAVVKQFLDEEKKDAQG